MNTKLIERLKFGVEWDYGDDAQPLVNRADDLMTEAAAVIESQDAEIARLNAAWKSSFDQAMENGARAAPQAATDD